VDIVKFVAEKVKTAYWDEDITCSLTALRVLSDAFEFPIGPEILQVFYREENTVHCPLFTQVRRQIGRESLGPQFAAEK